MMQPACIICHPDATSFFCCPVWSASDHSMAMLQYVRNYHLTFMFVGLLWYKALIRITCIDKTACIDITTQIPSPQSTRVFYIRSSNSNPVGNTIPLLLLRECGWLDLERSSYFSFPPFTSTFLLSIQCLLANNLPALRRTSLKKVRRLLALLQGVLRNRVAFFRPRKRTLHHS